MNKNISKIISFLQNAIHFFKLRWRQSVVVFIITLAGTFTLAAADCQVTLQWNPNTDGLTAGYKLFQRQENGSYNYAAPIYKGPANQCEISNLNEGTAYYFVVRAYGSEDNMSGDSNEARFICNVNPPEALGLANPENGAADVPLEPMMTTGPFYDADAKDNHASTQWQIFRNKDGLCLFEMTSDIFLTDYQLPPLILDGSTTYYWTARHFNQNQEGSPEAGSAFFTTAPDFNDNNSNGIPDDQEVPVTAVIPGSARTDLKCFMTASGNMNIGVGVYGSAVNLIGVQAVSPDRLDTPPSANPNLPIGLIGFKIEVAQPVETASMTIYFSNAIPGNIDWLYYTPAGYAQIKNSISTSDHKSVTLQLQDGGDGDMDGVANGIIVGFSGYGSSSSGDTNSDAPSTNSGDTSTNPGDASTNSGATPTNLNGNGSSSSKYSPLDDASGCFIDTLSEH